MNDHDSAILRENARLKQELAEAKDELNRLREALQDREEHKKMIEQDAEFHTRYWLPEEHQRFLVGLKMYGHKDIKSIARFVGTRSSTQVRTHAQKYFMKLDKHGKSLQDLGLPERPEQGLKEESGLDDTDSKLSDSNQRKKMKMNKSDSKGSVSPASSRESSDGSSQRWQPIASEGVLGVPMDHQNGFSNNFAPGGAGGIAAAGLGIPTQQPNPHQQSHHQAQPAGSGNVFMAMNPVGVVGNTNCMGTMGTVPQFFIAGDPAAFRSMQARAQGLGGPAPSMAVSSHMIGGMQPALQYPPMQQSVGQQPQQPPPQQPPPPHQQQPQHQFPFGQALPTFWPTGP